MWTGRSCRRRVVCKRGPLMLISAVRLVKPVLLRRTTVMCGEIPGAKLLEFHDVARDAGVYIVPPIARRLRRTSCATRWPKKLEKCMTNS